MVSRHWHYVYMGIEFPDFEFHDLGLWKEGEGVTDLKPGDHVLPVFTEECKECPTLPIRGEQHV